MHARVVPTDKPEIILKRAFNAPRALVYTIWTEPKYVQVWWGVDGSTIVTCELDVRTGGSFRIDMKASDGTIYVNRGIYLDIVPNERIVSRDQRDPNVAPGNLPTATHTVCFEDAPGGTMVTLTSRFDTFDDRDLMVHFGVADGISQSLERLQRLLISMQTNENN